MKTTSDIGMERVRFSINARYNPIRILTPDLLSRFMDSFQLGFLRELAIVYDAIERRDPFIRNCALKRKKSVARQQWEILAVDESDDAKAQKEALEFFYNNLRATDWMDQNRSGGLSLLIRQMMDAVGKKYSVHEIVFKPTSAPGGGQDSESALKSDTMLTAEFRACPLWWFENRRGKLRLLPQEFAVDGVEMPEGEWMVTVGEGIMEPSAVSYMYKHLSLKDWVAYTEKFAFPSIKGTTTAPKGSDEWDLMVDYLKNFGNDNAVLMNVGENVEAMELTGQGNEIYKTTVEYFDRAIACIWRGADLSTISSSVSDAHGASVQGNETNLLLEDDCALVSETFNTQVDPAVLRYYFGDAPQLAYFKLLPPRNQDAATDVAVDTFLRSAGFPLSIKSVAERYGREIPDEEDELLTAAPAPGSGAEGLSPTEGPDIANIGPVGPKQVDVHRLAKAFAEDLQPLRNRIERILQIDDPDILRSKLTSLVSQLPQLLSDLNADPESARVLEDALNTGLLTGIRQAQRQEAAA